MISIGLRIAVSKGVGILMTKSLTETLDILKVINPSCRAVGRGKPNIACRAGLSPL